MTIDWEDGVLIEGDWQELDSLRQDIEEAMESGHAESQLLNMDGLTPIVVRRTGEVDE